MAVHEESKQFTRYVCVLASGSKDEFKPLWETSKALHGHYRRPSVSIRFYIHNIWTLAFHWPTVHVSMWVCQPVEVEIGCSHNKHSCPVKVQKYEGSSREIQSHMIGGGAMIGDLVCIISRSADHLKWVKLLEMHSQSAITLHLLCVRHLSVCIWQGSLFIKWHVNRLASDKKDAISCSFHCLVSSKYCSDLFCVPSSGIAAKLASALSVLWQVSSALRHCLVVGVLDGR